MWEKAFHLSKLFDILHRWVHDTVADGSRSQTVMLCTVCDYALVVLQPIRPQALGEQVQPQQQASHRTAQPPQLLLPLLAAQQQQHLMGQLLRPRAQKQQQLRVLQQLRALQLQQADLYEVPSLLFHGLMSNC